LKANNPELGAALEANDTRLIEKIVGEKLKAQFDAQKLEQERVAKLMNADPNDAEAQKQIEEEIRKSLIQKNYMTA
jgi:DNA damage-inducible protein 1